MWTNERLTRLRAELGAALVVLGYRCSVPISCAQAAALVGKEAAAWRGWACEARNPPKALWPILELFEAPNSTVAHWAALVLGLDMWKNEQA